MAAIFKQAGIILHDSARASGPALRTFEKIADRWALKPKERQALLDLSKSTYFNYVQHADKARLSLDTLQRTSYVPAIYKALQILLPRSEAADSWIRRTNAAPVFNGHTPLNVILDGKVSNLHMVRYYLDGERG